MEDPDNFCCSCGVPIGDEHGPNCGGVSYDDFIVTGNYATWSGNFSTFRFEISASNIESAMSQAETRLKADKRRKYMGKLDMSASVV